MKFNDDGTPEDIAPLKELIEGLEKRSDLNDFEQSFLTTMTEKVKRFGEQARFSPKQIGVIHKLEERAYGL